MLRLLEAVKGDFAVVHFTSFTPSFSALQIFHGFKKMHKNGLIWEVSLVNRYEQGSVTTLKAKFYFDWINPPKFGIISTKE